MKKKNTKFVQMFLSFVLIFPPIITTVKILAIARARDFKFGREITVYHR